MIVVLIGLPPVIVAYRVIANRRHNLVFICSMLPPLLFAMLFTNRFLFGEEATRIGASILGIALIVFITDLIASFLLIIFGPRYFRPGQESS